MRLLSIRSRPSHPSINPSIPVSHLDKTVAVSQRKSLLYTREPLSPRKLQSFSEHADTLPLQPCAPLSITTPPGRLLEFDRLVKPQCARVLSPSLAQPVPRSKCIAPTPPLITACPWEMMQKEEGKAEKKKEEEEYERPADEGPYTTSSSRPSWQACGSHPDPKTSGRVPRVCAVTAPKTPLP